MKHLLILSLLVALGTGAPQDISDRIAGGSLAVEGEFPYIASVQFDRRHHCSGFIYNERWILTTASCVSEYLSNQLQVVVGIVSLITPSTQQQTIQVSSIVIHDNYDSVTKMNDIALISLIRPVVYGSAVQAIRYDEVDESIFTAITMGWGATTESGVEVTKLRKTVLTLPADCSSYDPTEFNNNLMICSGSADSSPCQYDEGSPLVQNGIAVGIMSKNKGCAAPYTPSIFTRLSIYYYWLNGIGGQQSFPTTSAPTTTTTAPATTVSVPTAPCINCETTSTTPIIPTAPCLNCETPTTTQQPIPTAPCLNCDTPTTTTPKPTIPTAPCINCAP
uniref:Peptidase S1 domain-containing protein n=1 Tax=Daphnia galeata TaxID=27404 RepID=A0A8J2RNF2_9CRUS|nr:unnamed protein product [Daphnia galeata]